MANNLSGISYTNNFNNLDGLSIVQADQIYVDGASIDPALYVPYTGANKTIDLNNQNIQTTRVPTTNSDLTNKFYVDGAITTGGGTTLSIVNMNFVRYSGSISDTDLGTYNIKTTHVPSAGADLCNKTYVDTQDALRVPYTGATSNVVLTGTTQFQQAYNAVSGTDPTVLVNRQTLDSAISGLGAGILNLNNVWTGTNSFNNTLSNSVGYTTNLNGVFTDSLNSLGYGPGDFSTAGVVGVYTPPLGTITGPVSGVYTMTQTASGRSVMRIPAFGVGVVQTTYVFSINIKCSVGTATISVEQDNTLISPALYQLSTSYQTITGSFTVNGTSNSPVFKIYTGVASWTAQWDSFTLSTYSANITAPLTITSSTILSPLTASRALVLDSSKAISVSATTATELGYLSGVSGPIQTQFGNYVLKAGDTMTGTLTATGFVVGGNGAYIAGCIYSDVNWGMLFRARITGAAANFVWQDYAGTERLRIGTTGDITTSAGKFIATGTIAGINGGSAFAIPNNYMATGSLTLGDITKNYGGGSSWNSNTAGLLMECLDNTEIAIHDAGSRIASFMYYTGNQFTMGRDMGWGQASIYIPGGLTFGGGRYLYSPEAGGSTYGSMCVRGAGRNGWQGYSINNLSGQHISFMMADSSLNFGIYNSSSGTWNFYVGGGDQGDVSVLNTANTRGFKTHNSLTSNVIYNTQPTTASNIGSWSGYGYTLLSNSQVPAGNSPCMGLGCNYSNTGQITCLQPGIAWMNLAIFNAQTTFTYYGVACGYTVPSGGANVSDVREKHSISDVNTKNSLKKIMAIKPKYYKRKYYDDGVDENGDKKTRVPDYIKDQVCIGVMAQDLLDTPLAPAITIAPLKNENIVPTADDDGSRYGVNYGDLNIHMIGAVQEIVKQSTSFASQIQELSKTITSQATLVQEINELKKQNDVLTQQIKDIVKDANDYKLLTEERFNKLVSLIQKK